MFEAFTRELLKAGLCVRFEARGASMSPCIRDGEIVHITPVIVSKLRKDDIVLARSNNSFRVHRLVLVDQENDTFVTRGDCGQQDDPAVRGEEILGIATAKEVRVRTKSRACEIRRTRRTAPSWSCTQSVFARESFVHASRGVTAIFRQSTHLTRPDQSLNLVCGILFASSGRSRCNNLDGRTLANWYFHRNIHAYHRCRFKPPSNRERGF